MDGRGSPVLFSPVLLFEHSHMCSKRVRKDKFWDFKRPSEGLARLPLFCFPCFTKSVRSFEKGLADRGGWREETLQRPAGLFSVPFSYAPSGEWGHISGELCGGLFVASPLPPTPFRNLRIRPCSLHLSLYRQVWGPIFLP